MLTIHSPVTVRDQMVHIDLFRLCITFLIEFHNSSENKTTVSNCVYGALHVATERSYIFEWIYCCLRFLVCLHVHFFLQPMEEALCVENRWAVSLDYIHCHWVSSHMFFFRGQLPKPLIIFVNISDPCFLQCLSSYAFSHTSLCKLFEAIFFIKI